jgi:hypothetical protein
MKRLMLSEFVFANVDDGDPELRATWRRELRALKAAVMAAAAIPRSHDHKRHFPCRACILDTKLKSLSVRPR